MRFDTTLTKIYDTFFPCAKNKIAEDKFKELFEPLKEETHKAALICEYSAIIDVLIDTIQAVSQKIEELLDPKHPLYSAVKEKLNQSAICGTDVLDQIKVAVPEDKRDQLNKLKEHAKKLCQLSDEITKLDIANSSGTTLSQYSIYLIQIIQTLKKISNQYNIDVNVSEHPVPATLLKNFFSAFSKFFSFLTDIKCTPAVPQLPEERIVSLEDLENLFANVVQPVSVIHNAVVNELLKLNEFIVTKLRNSLSSDTNPSSIRQLLKRYVALIQSLINVLQQSNDERYINFARDLQQDPFNFEAISALARFTADKKVLRTFISNHNNMELLHKQLSELQAVFLEQIRTNLLKISLIIYKATTGDTKFNADKTPNECNLEELSNAKGLIVESYKYWEVHNFLEHPWEFTSLNYPPFLTALKELVKGITEHGDITGYITWLRKHISTIDNICSSQIYTSTSCLNTVEEITRWEKIIYQMAYVLENKIDEFLRKETKIEKFLSIITNRSKSAIKHYKDYLVPISQDINALEGVLRGLRAKLQQCNYPESLPPAKAENVVKYLDILAYLKALAKNDEERDALQQIEEQFTNLTKLIQLMKKAIPLLS